MERDETRSESLLAEPGEPILSLDDLRAAVSGERDGADLGDVLLAVPAAPAGLRCAGLGA
jgi:hypothetical protein